MATLTSRLRGVPMMPRIRTLPHLLQLDALTLLSAPDDPLTTYRMILRLTYSLTPVLMGLALMLHATHPLLPPLIIFELGLTMLVFTAIQDWLLQKQLLQTWMHGVHLGVSLLLLAVAVTYSGGVQSPLAWMFALSMAIEGILYGRRWALASATLSSVYLVGSTLVVRQTLSPFSGDLWTHSATNAFLLTYIGMFYITATVTSSVGAWARQRNAEVSRLTRRIQQSYMGVIHALATAVATRDAYMGNHSQRVERSALTIARRLGLDETAVEQIRIASICHDIGKIGVPDAILRSPNALRPGEMAIVRRHVVDGAAILANVPFLEEAALLVRHSHEWYDGTGYPDGLEGEAIPLGSRIVHVIDAYEAMTSDRPYRKALSHEAAVAELRKMAGRQFDPRIAKLFVRLLEWEGPESAFVVNEPVVVSSAG